MKLNKILLGIVLMTSSIQAHEIVDIKKSTTNGQWKIINDSVMGGFSGKFWY